MGTPITGRPATRLIAPIARRSALIGSAFQEIEIPVRDLDDATMLRIMAHENQEGWVTSAIIVQETVRAVVVAFADGKVKLEPLAKGTKRGLVRVAPMFAAVPDNKSSEHQEDLLYTAASVHTFLDKDATDDDGSWGTAKVEAALISLSKADWRCGNIG